MKRYPIYWFDTRLVPKADRQGEYCRRKVLVEANGGAYPSLPAALCHNVGACDLVIRWGEIGVVFSDMTCGAFSPEDAEEFWQQHMGVESAG